MHVTTSPTQTERKPQDRSVRRAEKRRRLAGMLRAPGPIRTTPGAFATSCNTQGEKRLFNWQNQAILTSDGRPLGDVGYSHCYCNDYCTGLVCKSLEPFFNFSGEEMKLSLTLPKAIIVDANCLLNSAFLPASFASLALKTALRRNVDLITSKEALEEAEKQLNRICKRHSVSLSTAIEYFKAHILRANVKVIDIPGNPDLPKHDNHIYSAAKKINCPVLSTDQPLLKGLEKARMDGFHPLDFTNQFDPEIANAAFGEPVTDEHAWRMVHGVNVTIEAGTIFIRFEPEVWCESDDAITRTILDIENLLKITYDNTSKHWHLIFDFGISVSQKLKMISAKKYVILVSWDNIRARFWVSGNMHSADGYFPVDAAWPKSGRMFICNSRDESEHFSGYLFRLVTDNRMVGKNVRRAIMDPDSEMSLNPFDNDRLESGVVQILTR